MQILGLLLLGLIIGWVAKLLMPGKDPGGFLISILLGIAGALVGGFLAEVFKISGGWMTSFALGVVGAMLLLGVYRLLRGAVA